MTGGALDNLVGALRRAGVEFSAEDLADALWLAPRLPRRTNLPKTFTEEPPTTNETGPPSKLPPPPPVRVDPPDVPRSTKTTKEKSVPVHLPAPTVSPGEGSYGVKVRLPDAPGIPQALEIARKMRPLRRREPTTRYLYLDEARTAERLAASDIWLPVLKPGMERWLRATLVIDIGASMAIWQTVLRAFRRLIETLGAFRTVEQWWLDTEDPAWTHEADSLTPLFVSKGAQQFRRRPLDVVNPSGRQFILVISDCVSDAWRDGRVGRLLGLWGKSTHTALLQVLPRNTWERTALGPDRKIVLRSSHAACPNSRIAALVSSRFRGVTKVPESDAVALPVLEFGPQALGTWARWLVQDAGGTHSGRLLEFNPPLNDAKEEDRWTQAPGQPFLTLASEPARRLANIMAVAPPFNLPLLRVIRESMLAGKATQVHEAEFLLGSLVKIIAGHDLRLEHPDEVLYDFHSEELRKLFRAAVPVPEALRLLRLEQVSRYLGERLGQPRTFPAYLSSPANYPGALQLDAATNNDPIARFTSSILQWFGGPYAALLRETPSPAPDPRTPAAATDGAKILVVGSFQTPSVSPGEYDTFVHSCKLLGKALAEARFTIIVGSTNDATVDPHILEGANEADGRAEIVIMRPRDRSHNYPPLETRLPNLSVQLRKLEGDWQDIRGPQVAEADAIVAIGGTRGTRAVIDAAITTQKPLLPLGRFGGSAQAAWPAARQRLFASGIDKSTIDALEKGFDASLIVSVIRSLLQHAKRIEDQKPQQDLGDVAADLAGSQDKGRARPDAGDRLVRRTVPRWAITIGVNEYQDDTLPPLSYPLRDAETLSELLVHNGYPAEQVVVLKNEQATRAAVLDALRRLGDLAENGDLLLFHFSGHAIFVRGEPILLLTGSTQSNSRLGLSLVEVLNALRLSGKELRLVFLLDAGRHGQFLKDVERTAFGSFWGNLFRNTTPSDITVLAACTPEVDESSGGLVVKELLEGNGMLVSEVLECVNLWADAKGIQDISVGDLMDYFTYGMSRNEQVFHHQPKWLVKEKGKVDTVVFRRPGPERFEIDQLEITLTISPQRSREYQVGTGRFRRTVQCDNVANLVERVTFAGTNRLRRQFMLRYTTTGGGFVEALRWQVGEGPTGRLLRDDYQNSCMVRFEPKAGETYSLWMRIFQGYGPGNRFVKFRLPESNDYSVLAHYKTVRLVLDLLPYIEAGYVVQPAPRLVSNSTWHEGADPAPVGKELPISRQSPGQYTWELQNMDQTVLNLVWDVVKKDSLPS